MTDTAFYWLGVGVAAGLALVAIVMALLWIYFTLIQGRFGLIFFRKSERRLSISSWYNSRLMSDEHFHADDYPIGKRPFFIMYRIGERRFFVMAGTHGPLRHMAVTGKHPEQQA